MGNSQGSPDTAGTDDPENVVGYRILGSLPNSPASEMGLVHFFDYIVAADGIPFEELDNTLLEIIVGNVGREIDITIYNSKSQTYRDLAVTPSMDWEGQGLLGLKVCWASVPAHRMPLLRVAEVFEGSPADAAGLMPERDFLLGDAHRAFDSNAVLYHTIKGSLDKPLHIYVYNMDADFVRITTIFPTYSWGGGGCFGARVELGLAGQLPDHCLRTLGRATGYVAVGDTSVSVGQRGGAALAAALAEEEDEEEEEEEEEEDGEEDEAGSSQQGDSDYAVSATTSEGEEEEEEEEEGEEGEAGGASSQQREEGEAEAGAGLPPGGVGGTTPVGSPAAKRRGFGGGGGGGAAAAGEGSDGGGEGGRGESARRPALLSGSSEGSGGGGGGGGVMGGGAGGGVVSMPARLAKRHSGPFLSGMRSPQHPGGYLCRFQATGCDHYFRRFEPWCRHMWRAHSLRVTTAEGKLRELHLALGIAQALGGGDGGGEGGEGSGAGAGAAGAPPAAADGALLCPFGGCGEPGGEGGGGGGGAGGGAAAAAAPWAFRNPRELQAHLLEKHGLRVLSQPSAEDRENAAALAQAVKYGRKGEVKELLAAGAQPHWTVPEADGKSSPAPLHLACKYGKAEIAEMLLEAGAQADQRDATTGATPLALACYHARLPLVQMMLRHGAHRLLADHAGQKPGEAFAPGADAAARREVLRLLRGEGAAAGAGGGPAATGADAAGAAGGGGWAAAAGVEALKGATAQKELRLFEAMRENRALTSRLEHLLGDLAAVKLQLGPLPEVSHKVEQLEAELSKYKSARGEQPQ